MKLKVSDETGAIHIHHIRATGEHESNCCESKKKDRCPEGEGNNPSIPFLVGFSHLLVSVQAMAH
jgi:hypothetical protein